MKQMRSLLLVMVAAVLTAACSSLDCSIDNVVAAKWQLRSASGLDTLKVDTLTITTARTDGQDTTLYNKGIGITAFTLPMSYAAEQDVLFLHLADTAQQSWRDTITVSKTNQLHMESVECSPQYYHTITGLSYTSNIIDSIVINDPNVTNDATKQNLYIYLRSRR